MGKELRAKPLTSIRNNLAAGGATPKDPKLLTRIYDVARGKLPNSGSAGGYSGARNYYREVFNHPDLTKFLDQMSRNFKLLSRLKPVDLTVNYTGNILQNYRNALAGGMGAFGAGYAAINEASMIWVAQAGVAGTAALYSAAAGLGACLGLGAGAGLEKIQTAVFGESYTSSLVAGGIRAVAGMPSRSFTESWDDFDKKYLWWLP